eukprot:3878048-Lingulodinium_polyedra.AAC.1
MGFCPRGSGGRDVAVAAARSCGHVALGLTRRSSLIRLSSLISSSLVLTPPTSVLLPHPSSRAFPSSS